MGMPDKKAIVERLKADPTYYKPITDLYGESIWADTDKIYAIMEKSHWRVRKTGIICAILFKI